MGKTPIPFSPGPLLTFKAFPLGKVERFKKGKSGKGGKVASATWARADTCHQRRETVRRQEQKEQQRSRRLNTDIRITNLSSKALESKIKTKGRENVFLVEQEHDIFIHVLFQQQKYKTVLSAFEVECRKCVI